MSTVIKETTYEINKRIAAFENERLVERLRSVPNCHNIFGEVKKLAGKKTKRAEDCIFVVDGQKIGCKEGKADVMRKFYLNLYRESTPVNDKMLVIEEVNEQVKRWRSGIVFSAENDVSNPKDKEWSVSNQELEWIKSRMNNKKSCGEDGLPNYIIKKCPKIFWDITRIIINNCFANCYFPSSWKKAIIVPIPKTATAEKPEDFMPRSPRTSGR